MSRAGERGGRVGRAREGSGGIGAEGEERDVARTRIDGARGPLKCVYVGDKGWSRGTRLEGWCKIVSFSGCVVSRFGGCLFRLR